MAGRDYWLSIAQSADADDLREHILTGFKDGKPFTPYVPTIQLPPEPARPRFRVWRRQDVPLSQAHSRARDRVRFAADDRALPHPRGRACRCSLDDWKTLRTERFDLIVSVLVLQHIEPAICSDYLRDFARMAPATYLLSRADNDFGSNVFATIASTGLFDVPGDSVEVEHDPATNQLRVLGRRSFGEICAPETAGHFEVLLRSRSAA